ncbi:MAG: hypothetical protein ABI670_20905 [Chloroflexota bacterium]
MTSLISPTDIQQAEIDEAATLEPSTAPSPSSQPESLREPWGVLAALVLLGGISGIAYYLGFVRPYLLEQYFATPLLDLAKINNHTAPAANEWAFTWLVVFACYYIAFRLCPSGATVTRTFRRMALFLICGWAAFFAINLIFMYPVGAADIFDQIFRARLTAHYSFNPFTTLPSTLGSDPLQAYVAWKGDPSPYGPMWEALAAGTSFLAGDSLWRNLILFKLLVSVAYGISVALTYGILRAYKPDWALRGTLFYAWNPLVLFEVMGNGHNDAIVVMFMLAGVYAFVLARRWAVLPALVAGALTKFVPILLVPVAVAAIWRDRLPLIRSKRRRAPDDPPPTVTTYDRLTSLGIGAVISVGLGLVLYAPFWTGLSGILPRNRGNLFTVSIPKLVVDTLVRDMGVPEATAQFIVRNTAYALVGLIAVGLALWILKARDATTPEERDKLVGRTLSAFYEIIFAYLAIAALWFQPWYLMWLVALTAPLARIVNVHRTLLFCIGGVANYFVWDFILLWNHSDPRSIQIAAAIAVYTLPFLYTLYVWLRPRFSEL